jgi:hypothetical protein
LGWHVLLLLSGVAIRVRLLLSFFSFNYTRIRGLFLVLVLVIVISCAIELLSHLDGWLTSHWNRGHSVHPLGVLNVRADIRLSHVKLTGHHRCSRGVVHARMRRHLVHHTRHSLRINLRTVSEV